MPGRPTSVSGATSRRGADLWEAYSPKGFVRDYLLSVPGWNGEPPAPPLTADVVEKTADKYRDAYRRLTGHDLP